MKLKIPSLIRILKNINFTNLKKTFNRLNLSNIFEYIKKRVIKWILITSLFIVAFIIVSDLYITISTQSRIYKNVSSVPEFNSALVLGTSKYYKGRLNQFYRYRIEDTVELYKSGKIKEILVSGDSSQYYVEPRDMRKDLVELGVPDEYITSDYNGYRTLDSVIRAKEVFKLDSFIVVSQEFHLERALFIARANNINAYGYTHGDKIFTIWYFRARFREIFARVMAVIDVVVLKKSPKSHY